MGRMSRIAIVQLKSTRCRRGGNRSSCAIKAPIITTDPVVRECDRGTLEREHHIELPGGIEMKDKVEIGQGA